MGISDYVYLTATSFRKIPRSECTSMGCGHGPTRGAEFIRPFLCSKNTTRYVARRRYAVCANGHSRNAGELRRTDIDPYNIDVL